MLRKISPTLFGVMSSLHSWRCARSAAAASVKSQFTRADSAYRLYMTLLTCPVPCQSTTWSSRGTEPYPGVLVSFSPEVGSRVALTMLSFWVPSPPEGRASQCRLLSRMNAGLSPYRPKLQNDCPGLAIGGQSRSPLGRRRARANSCPCNRVALSAASCARHLAGERGTA